MLSLTREGIECLYSHCPLFILIQDDANQFLHLISGQNLLLAVRIILTERADQSPTSPPQLRVC